MNPLGIISIIIAAVVGYYALSGSGFSVPFLGGGGPIATGPGRGAEVENPEPPRQGFFSDLFGFGPGGTPASEPSPRRPGESPYKGVVRIGAVERSSPSASGEYATIRYGGGFFGFGGSGNEQPIDVTGWRIATRRTSEAIPRAYNIPEIDTAESDIILPPGGTLIVVAGESSYPRNFRENRCVGYFNEHHAFTPSLSDSCANASSDRSGLLSRGFNGACIEAIEAIPTCRMPRGPFAAGVIGSSCLEYINRNFNYAACVENFRDERNFLGDTWRASLRRTSKMFDPLHDRVILRDQNGLLVDELEY